MLIELFTPLDEPSSRLFHLNLAASTLLIIVWTFFQLRKKSQSISSKILYKIFFSKKYWWNKSTRLDYKVYLLNGFLKIAFFVPFFDGSMFIGQKVLIYLVKLKGSPISIESNFLNLSCFTAFIFILDDFLRFTHHLFMHRISFLWKLHELHHSAHVLTPITLFRIHPLESAIAALRNSLSVGLSLGLFLFLFNSDASIVTFMSINVFGFIFNLLGSNLRHSHIPLGFGPFEMIFISPRLHQIHHSRNQEHYNKNFGVSLTIWDAFAGTLLVPKEQKPLKFGTRKLRTLTTNL